MCPTSLASPTPRTSSLCRAHSVAPNIRSVNPDRQGPTAVTARPVVLRPERQLIEHALLAARTTDRDRHADQRGRQSFPSGPHECSRSRRLTSHQRALCSDPGDVVVAIVRTRRLAGLVSVWKSRVVLGRARPAVPGRFLPAGGAASRLSGALSMMANDPPYSPDIFSAATLMATRDGVSVDVALARLHRGARAAGLSPLTMANLIITGAVVEVDPASDQT